MLNTVVDMVKMEQEKYSAEGFLILAIFGSHARGDADDSSDVDILFELTSDFRVRYRGFKAVQRLEKIRSELASDLGKAVDLVDRNAMGDIAPKYILAEAVYV